MRNSVLDVCLAVTSHEKMCLHDGSDDGPGPGTYSSQKQAYFLFDIINDNYAMHYILM